MTSSPSVTDILLARAARRSRAPHGDGFSVALAVEGGAMRGVISAGMVSGLEQLGLTDAFDAVYGSSAGAINAAYLLAGQAALGTTIYYDEINNRRFINAARPFWGQSIVDLGVLIDDVAIRRKPLAVARVLASAAPLAVLATDVDAEARAVLRGFTSGPQLLAALRAGATMPVMAGAPRTYDGRRYLDASLTEPVPVPVAEEEGHTHILALLTRSGAMRDTPSAFDRYFVGPRLRRLSPALADRYLSRAEPYAALARAIDAGTGPLGRSQVLGVRVAGLRISKLERRRDTLIAAAERGQQAVVAAFAARIQR